MSNLIEHKKAYFNYEVLDSYEAGIELFGFEVKSVRNHQASLEGAHVIIRGGEAFLMGMTIQPYQQKNTPIDYEPMRNRKLLLTKKEIAELAEKESTKGLTIVPLALYSKGRRIKIRVAVCRGKKQFDKRETIKKRDTDRDIRRSLKSE